MLSGTRTHAEALLDEVAEVLSGLGLRLAMDKTRVVRIDEGIDFPSWRIQRHRKRGTSKYRKRSAHVRSQFPGIRRFRESAPIPA